MEEPAICTLRIRIDSFGVDTTLKRLDELREALEASLAEIPAVLLDLHGM
jgi:hypothetical protein